MSRAVYEIKQSRFGANKWYWRLVAGNGEILGNGQMHSEKGNAKKAAITARRNSRFAKIV